MGWRSRFPHIPRGRRFTDELIINQLKVDGDNGEATSHRHIFIYMLLYPT